MTRRLTELSSVAAGQMRPIVAIPVGSCEQHGPHLPLGTDAIIAETLATRLADRCDGVVVGPTLTVTASGEHAAFAGTLSIGVDVTAAVLAELARSADWAAGLVLVNGHGGNAEAVRRAVATIRSEGRRVHSWWPVVADGDAHAGRTETSLLLTIAPHLVDVAAIETGDVRPVGEIAAELRAGGVHAVSRNGVLGDPSGATLEDGTQLLDMLTDDLVASVEIARQTWHADHYSAD